MKGLYKNNLYFIDNLKVILILLVVFGHLIERYIDTNSTLKGIYIFIYTFHMPLFVFISGFLSKNINKSSKVFIKNLLVPYIIFNIIWYSLVYLYMGKTTIPILYPGWTLWFLLSLFFWRISLKYLIRIKYILPMSFFAGLLVGLIPNGNILSFSRTIVFLPFFLLGYYLDMEMLKKIFYKFKFDFEINILGIILFFILALFISNKNILDYKFLYGSYSYSELSISIYQGIIYRSILYLSSLMLSIFICKIIPVKKTFYTEIGKSTMYVYSFHVYMILIIFYLIPTWNNNIFNNWIILVSPLFIIYILSRKFFEVIYNLMFSGIFKLIRFLV